MDSQLRLPVVGIDVSKASLTVCYYELGQRQERHVLAYQNRRWDSDFQSVRQVVESGELGQLIEVHFRFDRYKWWP